MSKEYVVGRAADIPEGAHRIVRAANREIGVFHMNGRWHAIPNRCPHQRGPVCEGEVSGTLDYGPHTDWKLVWTYEGEVVTCPWHSLEFHVPSGRCLALPHIKLRKFDVRVSGEDITVVV